MKNNFENPINSFERQEKEISETDLYPIVNVPLQQRYDRIASQWNTEVYDGIRRDDLIPLLIDSSEMGDGMVALDAMCGTGLLSVELQRRFPKSKVYALDFSRGMLNAVEGEVHKVQSSILAMPFPEHSFDRIFLRSAMYDVPKRAQLKALQEIRRILKKNGVFTLQTYYTTTETQEVLNNIVNIKDLMSGQYQDMGKEFPRYFATDDELNKWFTEAGFQCSKSQNFEGVMKYLQTKEMTELGQSMWVEYIEKLPKNKQHAIKLRREDNGNLVYNFPGAVYRLS
ncbi:MAG: methyltransferase domain-containing protein [Candidatus Moraniibacteriota bacterium]